MNWDDNVSVCQMESIISMCRVFSVAQLCLTLCYAMDYSPPGSSVHGDFPSKTLEWAAYPFSRGSSQPRNQTRVSCIPGGFFTNWIIKEDFVIDWCTEDLGYFSEAYTQKCLSINPAHVSTHLPTEMQLLGTRAPTDRVKAGFCIPPSRVCLSLLSERSWGQSWWVCCCYCCCFRKWEK